MINTGKTFTAAGGKLNITGIFAIVCSVLFFSMVLNTQAQIPLIISEFMANNVSALQDSDGDYSDWIELHNMTDADHDFSGYFLSDDPDNLIKWLFPQAMIPANGYLIVFASGKDRRAGELHTNFKLSASGENIILTQPDGQTVVFSLKSSYPPQQPDVSYSMIDTSWFFTDPTPGMQNQIGAFINPPRFSIHHGFFDSSFQLEIYPANGEGIMYTRDGSEPAIDHGYLYEGPIIVDTTTILRAVAFANGITSRIVSSTYLFPDMVQNQPDNPVGYPSNWGRFSAIDGTAPADYEMDPEICSHLSYRDLLVPALTTIPTISISTDKDNLFSHSTDPMTGGIYIHTDPPTGGLGEDWERAASAEYIHPDGRIGFQIDCGIRIHGGHSRVPEKNPKHSFRLVFREEYGPDRLLYPLFGDSNRPKFNSIVLRAGFNQSWLHWDTNQRDAAQYVNDSWAKDIWQKMGHAAANNQFVHLYLNGLYWGLYNISERMDDEFMVDHLGGQNQGWDVIKDYAEVAEGNKDAWNTMMELAINGLSDSESYYKIQGKNEFGQDDEALEAFLDIHNLIDYMILNFYAGNLDWDHHNWVAARNRVQPGKGFQFLPWDSERIFNSLNNNIVDENNEDKPSFLYSQLRKNPMFRMEFAQRANALLGPGGLLSPDSVKATWAKRSEEIKLAVIAESARWGDYRRDKHQHKNGPYELYTKNDHWDKEQDRLLNEYFPQRSQIVLDQLRETGLAGDIITGNDRNSSTYVTGIDSKVYPMPFTNQVNIDYRINAPGNVEIVIYSSEGKVENYTTEDHKIPGQKHFSWQPVNSLKGIYYYQIRTRDVVHSGKLIYIH